MFYILLTTILAGAPMPPTLTAYETQGRYIAACQEYDQTGNQKAIEVDIGSGDVVGYLECSDYADDVAQEPAFRAWYATMAKRLHLNPDPDDRRHCYDYRAFTARWSRARRRRRSVEGIGSRVIGNLRATTELDAHCSNKKATK
jgi:hypothetical protein